MENSQSLFSHSSLLLCEETEACFDEQELDDDDFEHNTFIHNSKSRAASNSDSDDDHYIETLIERETSFGFRERHENENEPSCSLIVHGLGWIECARRDAITWIFKTRSAFGFGFQTAYLSITYFDRFLFKRAIDSEKTWAIRLLAVACLSLAVKMEECRVPTLDEFEVEEYSFESKVIRRMELLVLNTLEWKMCSITPFAFVHYFISKLCNESPPPITKAVSKTIELILAMIKERNSMDLRPSIIAVVAALMALVQGLTRSELGLKIDSISSCQFLTDDVFSCYNLMQRIEMGKLERPQLVISPDLSPIHLSRANGLDGSSVTSGVSRKRRRLAMNDFDQNHGIPNGK